MERLSQVDAAKMILAWNDLFDSFQQRADIWSWKITAPLSASKISFSFFPYLRRNYLRDLICCTHGVFENLKILDLAESAGKLRDLIIILQTNQRNFAKCTMHSNVSQWRGFFTEKNYAETVAIVRARLRSTSSRETHYMLRFGVILKPLLPSRHDQVRFFSDMLTEVSFCGIFRKSSRFLRDWTYTYWATNPTQASGFHTTWTTRWPCMSGPPVL